MLKQCWKHRGSVTIFLAAIMLFMFVFTFSVFDVGKIYLTRNAMESATELALNAGLTTYDKTLKEIYGLLATSATEEELSDKLSKYFVTTLEASGIGTADEGEVQKYLNLIFQTDAPELDSEGFLKLSADVFNGGKAVSASGVAASAISNPTVMHRQIVEYMKYRGPISMASGILEKFGIFQDLSNQANATNKKLAFEDSLNDLATTAGRLYALLTLYQRNNAQLSGVPGTVPISKSVQFILSLSMPSIAVSPDELFKIENFSLSAGEIKKYCEDIYKDLYFAGLCGVFHYAYGSSKDVPTCLAFNSLSSVFTLDRLCKEKGFSPESLNLFSLSDEIKSNPTYVYLNGHSDITPSFLKGDPSPETYSVENDFERYKVLLNCQELFGANKAIDFGYDISTGFSELVIKAFARRQYIEQTIDLATPEEQEALLGEIIMYDDLHLEAELKKVESAVKELKRKGDERYDTAINKIKDLYGAAYQQGKLIDYILRPNGGLDTLLEELQATKAASEEWKNANKDVQIDSVRNDLEDQWASEAKTIDSITYTQIAQIKHILEEQRELFVSIKNSLRKYRVYGLILCSDNEYTYQLEKKNLKDCIDEGLNGSFFSTVQSFVNVDSIGFVPYPFEQYEFSYLDSYTGLWNCLNTEIQNTPVFEYLKKMCEATVETTDEQKENAENAKNKVDNGTKLNDGVPDNVSTENKTSPTNLNDVADFSAYYNSLLNSNVSSSSGGNAVSSVQMSKGGDEDQNKAAKSMATDALSSASGLFSDLGNILEKERDKLYITEYLNHMFSCHTTNNKTSKKTPETNLAGFSFTDTDGKGRTDWYQSELEYIIYGQSSPGANLALASASIFGIRFALNLIYSYTDAEIRAFTLSVATTIGAPLPFTIPLIQTVLHIGLSLAESALDLKDLLDGKSVPIFKTAGTWVCKGTGLVKKAVGKAVETVTETVVDGVSNWVVGLIKDSKGKAIEWTGENLNKLNEMANTQLDDLEKTVKSEFLTPIQNGIQEIITNGTRNNKEKVTATISGKIDQALSALENGSGENSLLGKARAAAVSALRSKKDQIVSTISNSLDDYIRQAISVAEEKENELFHKLESDLSGVFGTVKKKIKGLRGEVESGIKSAIDSAADALEDGVVVAADKIKETVSGKLDGLVSGGSSTQIIGGGKSVTAANMLSMDYKDYLYLFSLIGTHTNEAGMLERAAKLMQLNIRAEKDMESYNINAACTVIRAETRATVNTVFLGTLIVDRQIDTNSRLGVVRFRHTAYAGY